jgi:DNA-binding CsgD family transcriptional regulator
MFDLSHVFAAPPAAPAYRGPDRRSPSTQAAPPLGLFVQMLDEIDNGMVLLGEQAAILHINHAARAELDATHPLVRQGRHVQTRQSKDQGLLRDAMATAAQKGHRTFVPLGDGAQRVYVSVVPLTRPGILLNLGKRRLSQHLSLQAFARAFALTAAEERVLEALCEDCTPREIADMHRVKLATVRTQIGSIRAKTGAPNIRALVRQVAMLPPIVPVLKAP